MWLPCKSKGTPEVSSPNCNVILKFNAAIDWATDTIMLLSLISLLPSSVDMNEGLFIMPSVWSEPVEPRLSVIKRSGLLPLLPNFRSLYPIYLPRQVSWWHHMGHDMIWASYWPLNHLQFSSLAFLTDIVAQVLIVGTELGHELCQSETSTPAASDFLLGLISDKFCSC